LVGIHSNIGVFLFCSKDQHSEMIYFFLFLVSYFCKDSYSGSTQQSQHQGAPKKRKQQPKSPQKSSPRKRWKKFTSSLLMPSDAELDTSESEDNAVNEEADFGHVQNTSKNGDVYKNNMKKIKSLMNFVESSDLFQSENRKADTISEERNLSHASQKIKSFVTEFEQSNLFDGIISVVQERSVHSATNPMSAVLSEIILKEFFQWWQNEMNNYYEMTSSTDDFDEQQMNEKYSSVLASLEMMKNFYFIFFQSITTPSASASSPLEPAKDSGKAETPLLQQKLFLIVLNNFSGSTSNARNKEAKNFSILDYLLEEISQFAAFCENINPEDCSIDPLARFPLLLPAITSTHSPSEDNNASACYFHSVFLILRMMNEAYEYLLQNDPEFLEFHEKKFQQFCKNQKKVRDLLEKKIQPLAQKLLPTLSKVCFCTLISVAFLLIYSCSE
jgi:hypothetical protein